MKGIVIYLCVNALAGCPEHNRTPNLLEQGRQVMGDGRKKDKGEKQRGKKERWEGEKGRRKGAGSLSRLESFISLCARHRPRPIPGPCT